MNATTSSNGRTKHWTGNIKPSRTEIDTNAIPDSLKAFDNWVGWRWKHDDKKWTKVPKQANGRNASVSDADTWSDYATILAAYEAKECDGIGFVLSDDDSFIGIDLDECRDRFTGEILPEAREIIELLGS